SQVKPRWPVYGAPAFQISGSTPIARSSLARNAAGRPPTNQTQASRNRRPFQRRTHTYSGRRHQSHIHARSQPTEASCPLGRPPQLNHVIGLPARAIDGAIVDQGAALLLAVAPAIGRLSIVAHALRERVLARVPWVRCEFRGPVAELGTAAAHGQVVPVD